MLHLDADSIDRFRATNKGWQSRINEDLRKARDLARGGEIHDVS